VSNEDGGLRTADLRLQTSDRRLQTSDCRPRTSDRSPWSRDCDLPPATYGSSPADLAPAT